MNTLVTIPKNDTFVVIRKSYVEICGNLEAAILLGYLVFWEDIKRKVDPQVARLAEKTDTPKPLQTKLQHHTDEEIYDQLMGLISMKCITKAKKKLVELGFISLHKNPSPDFSFDRTTFYRIEMGEINGALASMSYPVY